ncbi:hypothetical protein EG346_19775 [Chryseobacterium carnipullorum]|uniref:Phage Tail Collar Domain n=1 Tax=Chryseobacterium carnipullorum TaxID=1124835 RepID=A0A376DYQ2_CHRCU|nr:hypothetical protein [Chryseobacterium carnipullorum]AZA50275.1 hypothetical protein EG346_19775 [Chryseobacterium carnipullorum]AZA65148.1 hypothetical protein EG345_10820 [Chryseobacterium carnipullorum]STC98219.1 Uncharacterised protein [Chryseobacterium carnipullorum]
MKKVTLLIPLIISGFCLGQVGINTNNPTAMLDVNGEARIRTLPVAPDTSQLLAVDSNGFLLKISSVNIRKDVVGDIKYSRDTSDSGGWYLLNGRSIASLPAAAQANSSALGFVTNIPNFINRSERAKSGAEQLGTVGGAANLILTRNNLPNFAINGTTAIAGSHVHTLTQIQNSGSGGTGRAFSANNNGPRFSTQGSTKVLTSSGLHTHASVTLNSNGGNQAFNLTPAYLVLNAFVYLGS